MHAAIERNSWRVPQDDIVQVVGPREKMTPEEIAYAGLSDGQYWRSVVLSLLAIAMIIAGITTAINWYGFVDELLSWNGGRVTLDEYLRNEISPERLLSPSWVSSRYFVFQNDDGSLSLHDVIGNNVSVLISNYTLRQLNVKGYKCSSDLKYILLKIYTKQTFKHPFEAHYTVYDVDNDHQIHLSINGDNTNIKFSELQAADWAGNTSTLIMVEENNIFIRRTPTDTVDLRITNSGLSDVIYNGVPDWLYQEEILKDPEKAFWSSADGSHLLYITFNDSSVLEMEFPWISKIDGDDLHKKFPTTRVVRYPIPGTKNPTVTLWVANLTNSNEPHKKLKPPEILNGKDYFLTSANWINDSNSFVYAVWMNRGQNFSIISYCEAPNWTCFETHTERAPDLMWLEIQQPPVFSEIGDSFLFLAPVPEGGNFYTQVKHATLKEQRSAVISHGSYEVLKILKWDTNNHLVFYVGTDDRDKGQQHLYVVNDQLSHEPGNPEPICLTCDEQQLSKASRSAYQNCSHFSAYISPTNSSNINDTGHYVLQCNGPDLPLAGLHNTGTNELITILYNIRKTFRPKLQKYALPTSFITTVPLPQGYKARIQLLLPPSWRQELRDAAFPVIVQVDGRPNSQSVSTKYETHWGTYMSSRKGVVYVTLDVRGSKGKSTESLYRKLGDIEVEDQITALRFLLNTYPYLDRKRIGVWGWGYGGYVTTLLMSSQDRLFKCGIAVAPISNWNYYNSAFTEKILGLRTDHNNNNAYVEAELNSRARNIQKDSLYVIQGLADMSVPYQHGVGLARSLTNNGVIFRHQIYANEGHHLSGVLKHAYRSMEDYFRQCLSLEDDDEQEK